MGRGQPGKATTLGLNRPADMVDAVGTTVYGYDAVGQALSEDGPLVDDTVSSLMPTGCGRG